MKKMSKASSMSVKKMSMGKVMAQNPKILNSSAMPMKQMKKSVSCPMCGSKVKV